jgi:hypothetical protein
LDLYLQLYNCLCRGRYPYLNLVTCLYLSLRRCLSFYLHIHLYVHLHPHRHRQGEEEGGGREREGEGGRGREREGEGGGEGAGGREAESGRDFALWFAFLGGGSGGGCGFVMGSLGEVGRRLTRGAGENPLGVEVAPSGLSCCIRQVAF